MYKYNFFDNHLITLFSLYAIALVKAFSKCSNSSFFDLIFSNMVFDIYIFEERFFNNIIKYDELWYKYNIQFKIFLRLIKNI